MKNLFKLILLLFVLSGSIFAQQDTVFYKFWFQYPGGLWDYSSPELEGAVVEGEYIPFVSHTLPTTPFNFSPFQGMYDALVGGYLFLDDGAIDNNVTLDIYFRNLNLSNGGFGQLVGEDLFFYIEIEVESDGVVYGPDDPFYFNDGKHFNFCKPVNPAYIAWMNLFGFGMENLGFAYLIDDSFSDVGITTSVTASEIWFKAEHLSKFGGGRNGLGAINPVEPEELEGTPEEFELNQNYPNPFNPSTKISYSIPAAGNVTLKVYNVLGTEVADLVNSYHNAGNYKVNFSGSDLASGIYFYELRLGNKSITRKMILMK